MPENIKVGILGGDKRQLITAERLSESFECAVWGFDSVYGTVYEKHLKNTVKCTDWESAVKCSDAVILPLPVTSDGVYLNCPLMSTEQSSNVSLESICEKLRTETLLVGGKIPPQIKLLASESGANIFDYYDSEELQIRNSVPTAEGAISACIENLPITILGMRAAVLGYGRIGRTLAQRLIALGADVFAVARSTKDLSWARCDGCIPITLNDFREFPVNCDALFNTVPFMLFDRELLSKLNKEVVIFELASGCAGIDTNAAAELGLRVIPLMSLPGKTSPATSGEIICSAIRDKLNKYFEGRFHK